MGHINIKLADLIFEKGKSKNKVCYHCEVQRTQLNNCNNKVSLRRPGPDGKSLRISGL